MPVWTNFQVSHIKIDIVTWHFYEINLIWLVVSSKQFRSSFFRERSRSSSAGDIVDIARRGEYENVQKSGAMMCSMMTVRHQINGIHEKYCSFDAIFRRSTQLTVYYSSDEIGDNWCVNHLNGLFLDALAPSLSLSRFNYTKNRPEKWNPSTFRQNTLNYI